MGLNMPIFCHAMLYAHLMLHIHLREECNLKSEQLSGTTDRSLGVQSKTKWKIEWEEEKSGY